MEEGEIIIKTYQQIKVIITEKLLHQGYQPIHEQHHDQVFNSRYIIWSNNEDTLRLTWDGKEQWFALEVTHDLPLRALSSWSQIIIVPFEYKNESPAYLKSIVLLITESLG